MFYPDLYDAYLPGFRPVGHGQRQNVPIQEGHCHQNQYVSPIRFKIHLQQNELDSRTKKAKSARFFVVVFLPTIFGSREQCYRTLLKARWRLLRWSVPIISVGCGLSCRSAIQLYRLGKYAPVVY